MLEGVVSTLLNKVLGEFVDDVQASQLDIGIWKGDIVLENLSLKENALRKFDLPIDVTYGYLGKLVVRIPWSNLMRDPVHIVIDRLYAVATPQFGSDYDASKEAETAYQAKEKALAAFEASRKKVAAEQTESGGGDFVARLVAKLVDNLQLTIQKVHVRYEDAVSHAQGTLALGVILDGLTVKTIPGDEETATAGVAFKQLTLSNLSVYWEDESFSAARSAEAMAPQNFSANDTREHILLPTGADVKLRLDTSRLPGKNSPQVDLQVDLEKLALQLDDAQFRQLLDVLSTFSSFQRGVVYRHLRPPRQMLMQGSSGRYRQYWRFAIDVALWQARRKLHPWAWSNIKQCCDDRHTYIATFKAVTIGGKSATADQKLALERLERRLDFADLCFYRTIAHAEMKRDRQGPEHQTTLGWLTSWMGSAAPANATISDEERRKLNESIGFDGARKTVVYARDYVRFRVGANLSGVQLLLRRKGKSQTSDVVSLGISGVGANVSIRPSSLVVSASLDAIILDDHVTTRGTAVPMIERTGDKEGKLLTLFFEQGPLDKHADIQVDLDLQPIVVRFKPAPIKTILRAFKPPEDRELKELQKAVARRLLFFTEQTRIGLQHKLTTHTTLDLKVNINAPAVIIPHEQGTIGIDLGQFTVKSELVDPARRAAVLATTRRLDESEMQELKSFMYDRFDIGVWSLQVVICEDEAQCFRDMAGHKTMPSHLLCPAVLDVTIEQCIVDHAAGFHSMRVSVIVETIHVVATNPKLRSLLAAVDGIVEAVTPAPSAADRPTPRITVVPELEYATSLDDIVGDRSKELLNVSESQLVSMSDDSVDDDEIEWFDALETQPVEPVPFHNHVTLLAELSVVGICLTAGTQASLVSPIVDQVAAAIDALEANFCQRLDGMSAAVSIRAVDVAAVSDSVRRTIVALNDKEGDSIKVSFAQSVASDESVARELGAIIGMVVLDAEPEVVMGLVVDALAIVDLPKSSGAEEATITEMPDEEHFDDADESFESVSVLDTSTTSELASPKVSATLLVDVKLGGVQLNCKHFDSQVAQIVLGHTSATVQVSDQLMVVEASAGPLGLEAGSERVMFTEEKHIATLLFRQTKGLAPDAFVQLRTAPLVLSVSPPSVNALASYGFAFGAAASTLPSKKPATTAAVAAPAPTPVSVEPAVPFRFDLHIMAPRFHINRTSAGQLADILVVDLGELSVSNVIHQADDDVSSIDSITLALKRAHVLSRVEAADMSVVERTLFEEFAVDATIDRSLSDTYFGVPKMEIGATVLPAKMSIADTDLLLILSTVDAFMSALPKPPRSAATPAHSSAPAAVAPAPVVRPRHHMLDLSLNISDISIAFAHVSAYPIVLSENRPARNELLLAAKGYEVIPVSAITISSTTVRMASRADTSSDIEVTVAAVTIDAAKRETSNAHNLPLLRTGVLNARVSRQSTGETAISVQVDSPHVTADVGAWLATAEIALLPLADAHRSDSVKPSSSPALPPIKDAGAEAPKEDGPGMTIGVHIANVRVAIVHPKASDYVELVVPRVVVGLSSTPGADSITVDVVDTVLQRSASDAPSTTILAPVTLGVKLDTQRGEEKSTTIVVDLMMLDLVFPFSTLLLLQQSGEHITSATSTSAFLNASLRAPPVTESEEEDIDILAKSAIESAGLDDGSSMMSITSSSSEASLPTISSQSLSLAKPLRNESLKVRLKGLSLRVLNDALETRVPLLDVSLPPSSISVNEWSGSLAFKAHFALIVNLYDAERAAWVPVLEKWTCSIGVSRAGSKGGMTIDFETPTRFELVFASHYMHVLLEAASSYSSLSIRPDKLLTEYCPYRITNSTGAPVRVWLSDGRKVQETQAPESAILVKDGDCVPFSVDASSWLMVAVGDSLVSGRAVDVSNLGVWTTRLVPGVNDAHMLLKVDVRYTNSARMITLRSTMLVRNCTDFPLHAICALDEQRFQKELPVGGEVAIPIDFQLDGFFSIVTNDDQHDASGPYAMAALRRLVKKEHKDPVDVLRCRKKASAPSDARDFCAQVGVYVENNTFVVVLLPPLTIENALPIPLCFDLIDKAAGRSITTAVIEPCGSMRCYDDSLVTKVHMNISLPEVGFATKKPLRIVHPSNEKERLVSDLVPLVTSGSDETLSICMNNSLNEHWKGGRHVVFFAQYLMVDRSGLGLYFKSTGRIPSNAFSSDKLPSQSSKIAAFPPESGCPVTLFASSKLERLASVRTKDSNWSKAFSIEATGTHGEMTLTVPKSTTRYQLGIAITVGSGAYHRSKVITYAPRHVLVSNCDLPLQFLPQPDERNTAVDKIAAVGQNMKSLAMTAVSTLQASQAIVSEQSSMSAAVAADPHHRVISVAPRQRAGCHLDERESTLSVRLGDSGEWSSPFRVVDVGESFVVVTHPTTGRRVVLRVDVELEGSIMFIKVFIYRGEPPYRLANHSSIPISFLQHGGRITYEALPGESVPFVWEDPLSTEHEIILLSGTFQRRVDLRTIGSSRSFEVNDKGRMKVTVAPESITTVVHLRPGAKKRGFGGRFMDSASAFKIPAVNRLKGVKSKSSSTTSIGSGVDAASALEDEVEDAQEGAEGVMAVKMAKFTHLRLNARIAGLGLSIISEKMKELLYLSVQDVKLNYSDSDIDRNVVLTVENLQIDDTSSDANFPVMLYQAVPKEKSAPAVKLEEIDTSGMTEQEAAAVKQIAANAQSGKRPFVHFAMRNIKQRANHVVVFQSFSLLLQEIFIDVSEKLLFRVLRLVSATFPVGKPVNSIGEASAAVPSPHTQDAPSTRVYFGVFELQPILLKLTFMHSKEAGEMNPDSFDVFAVVFETMTSAVGNIDGAPIKLNALEIRNLNATQNVLVSLIVKHYVSQGIQQVHMLLGSADLLGNPVGLFTGISTGVTDFFYEPINGLARGPEDFAKGLGVGTASLLKGVGFGVLNTATKFTGAVGSGLAQVTMDDSYQAERQAARVSARGNNATQGAVAGITSFGKGIGSGLLGVVKKPVEGAKSGGVAGFMGGVAKGGLGLVAKPVVGLIDATSHIAQGIRNQATDHRVAMRVRLPRHIQRSGVITPFSAREALGMSMMLSIDHAKLYSWTYVAHIEVTSHNTILLIAFEGVAMVDPSKDDVLWSVPFVALAHVSEQPSGFALTEKHPNALRSREHFVEIKEEGTRKSAIKTISETQIDWEAVTAGMEFTL